MNSKQVRDTFLNFFRSKAHQIVPSAPMVIKNDPTLMFTNAGMNQFKDIFLGNAPVKYPRVADTQKCLRVSGKHNDLEEVGVDTYHHTMFEMLGNWSFGDYFKTEAIEWAWELLTKVYQINPNILYVTVFEGDASENLPFDQEAYDCWKKYVSEDRILRGNKKDNFWEMGDTGPCGPCSEIHADLRSEEERKKVPGKELVNEGHPQVVEIWNNVFMEFNRKADGSLEKLPAQHVDTGMGFERLCMVLQGKNSTYDTDVFTPLISAIEQESGFKYGSTEKTDIAIRVMSDHIRTIAFAIADGQLPSNNKAGYVIRRILRRAVRYSYTFLNLKDPVLYKLVPVLSAQMGEQFPELKAQEDIIQRVIQEEEAAFLRTLATGIGKFNDHTANMPAGAEISGEFAFELFDTYGFPVDLSGLMAREKGLVIDMPGFEKCLNEQKNRSRAAAAVSAGDWVIVTEAEGTFIGYDFLEAETSITRYREVSAKGKKQYQVVLEQTPFYAESGGQVGDTGELIQNGKSFKVLDTKKEHGQIVHFLEQMPDPNETVTAKVDSVLRTATMGNHTATHLLHAALRKILGTHVEQKGSLVSPEYLRFDFSHFEKLSEEQITEIEELVNQKIRENISADIRLVSLEQARNEGAMALFGEKYGDVVRMVNFDPAYSKELCGGTHVKATGSIGLFKIISESAVAAGIRRIEAITGKRAEEYVRNELRLLNQVRMSLKGSKDPVKGIQTLVSENQQLEKKVGEFQREKALQVKKQLIEGIQVVEGKRKITAMVELDSPDVLKNLAFELKNQFNDLFLVLGNYVGSKPMLTVALGNELVEKGESAVNIVKELAREIKGGGGGQPFFATAGGSDPEGLKRAIEKAALM